MYTYACTHVYMLARPDRALVFPRFRDVGFLFFLPPVAFFLVLLSSSIFSCLRFLLPLLLLGSSWPFFVFFSFLLVAFLDLWNVASLSCPCVSSFRFLAPWLCSLCPCFASLFSLLRSCLFLHVVCVVFFFNQILSSLERRKKWWLAWHSDWKSRKR